MFLDPDNLCFLSVENITIRYVGINNKWKSKYCDNRNSFEGRTVIIRTKQLLASDRQPGGIQLQHSVNLPIAV